MSPEDTPRPRRWASLQTAAEYSDLSVKTVRSRIAQGKITGYRNGQLIRVDLNELDALMEPIRATKSGGAS